MQGHFRPEFLNRVDELIIFHSLRQEQLREIVKLQIQRLVFKGSIPAAVTVVS